MDLLRSEYLRQISDNLVLLLPNATNQTQTSGPQPATNDSRGTIKIALAAAIISFMVTIMFTYGFYRRRSAQMLKEKVHASISHYQAKRRKFFEEVEEDQRLSGAPPGWMTTDLSGTYPVPTVTWSVSDLTSDSQSIRSSLPMDRIAEEECENEHSLEDEEVVEQTEREIASTENPVSPDSELALFIAHWNQELSAPGSALASRGESGTHEISLEETTEVTPARSNCVEDFDATTGSELRGCRYLTDDEDDSSTEEESTLGDDCDASNDTDPTADTDKHGATEVIDDEPSSDSLTLRSCNEDYEVGLTLANRRCSFLSAASTTPSAKGDLDSPLGIMKELMNILDTVSLSQFEEDLLVADNFPWEDSLVEDDAMVSDEANVHDISTLESAAEESPLQGVALDETNPDVSVTIVPFFQPDDFVGMPVDLEGMALFLRIMVQLGRAKKQKCLTA